MVVKQLCHTVQCLRLMMMMTFDNDADGHCRPEGNLTQTAYPINAHLSKIVNLIGLDDHVIIFKMHPSYGNTQTLMHDHIYCIEWNL